MNFAGILTALSFRSIAAWVRRAQPGIHQQPAAALVEIFGHFPLSSITISLDFDEHTLRMGYGTLEAVEVLSAAGITPTHSPRFRSGILIVDDRGWIFSPTALYLEAEPQSDETPNAVELSNAQVKALAIRLSPAAKQEAIKQAASLEEAETIAQLPTELGVDTVAPQHLATVKAAIEIAPPVKFDVVRQVRVFEPYLQYVELSLAGAVVQRHRVCIPNELQNLGTSEDLEGKLKTTFDLIEKGSSLSSKALEDELKEIRNNFTPSLGKAHGRVVLKSAKPHLVKRLAALRTKLEDHQKKVETELQKKLDDSLKQVVEYYVPKAQATPADALLGSLLSSTPDAATVRWWIGDILSEVFPTAPDLIHKMVLEERNKDVTFETLNRPDFLESVEQAFPRINWDKRRFPRIPLTKAEAGASPGAASFLEDLIDACVMESYVLEHMAERDLLFHDTVAPHLAAYAPEASASQQRDFLTHLHQTLNAPGHPIRNRLLRLTADSPDLLAIIKQEGKV